MDVRMPDGTIIQGVPEGTTQADLQARLNKLDAPAPKKPVTNELERAATGFMDPIVGAAQVMDRFLVNPIRQIVSPGASSMEDYTKQRDAEYVAPEGVDVARMIGNVANPLNYMGGGGGIAKMAGQGAISGALAPTEAGDSTGAFLLKKAAQAGVGGAAGGVGGAITKGVIKPTADADALLNQGVRLTPGQATKPGGFLARQEERLTSLPFTGDVITGARRRAAEDVQSNVIERATGTPGLRTIDEANRAVSAAYKRSVPHMQANPEGLFEAANAYNAALKNPELTPEHAKILTGLWDKHFTNYTGLPSEGLKKLDSELGHLARKYDAGGPADQTLADELRSVMLGLRSGLEKGMPVEEAARLRAANKGFREMIPVNKAASARADQLATPRALEKAMARQARTEVTRMPADPLLDPAVRQMTQNIPDSGSAGRWAGTNSVAATLGALGAAPASLAYQPEVTKALLGRAGWQQGAGEYLDPTIQALIAALRQ